VQSSDYPSLTTTRRQRRTARSPHMSPTTPRTQHHDTSASTHGPTSHDASSMRARPAPVAARASWRLPHHATLPSPTARMCCPPRRDLRAHARRPSTGHMPRDRIPQIARTRVAVRARGRTHDAPPHAPGCPQRALGRTPRRRHSFAGSAATTAASCAARASSLLVSLCSDSAIICDTSSGMTPP